MKKMRLKAALTCLLLLTLLLLSVSGAMLYFGKTGLILGFPRVFLLRLHLLCAVSFVLFGICHFALNFGLFVSEAKSFRPKKGFLEKFSLYAALL